MKKILLAIFGAALLMVGCTKEIQTAVNDLNSRVSALETQVAANKAAIEKLQGGAVIQNVAQTATGWTITLSDNTVLTLYNGTNGTNGQDGAPGAPGKDGENGDAFFSSVEVDGDTVVIKLVDGTTFVLPLYVEFELELLTEDVVLKAAATTPLLYRIKGETPETKLHIVAGGEYKATVSENSPEILITAPAVLTPNNIVVMADRGDGKVSVKTINIVGQELEVSTTFARTAYFWSDSFKMNVVSNVPVTFSSDVPWLTFEGTKATEEYEVTVKVAVTPSCKARTGNVIVKDPEGNIVQNLAVTQDGCSTFFLNNQKAYATWDDAAAALATATADGQNIGTDGSVQVIISQDAELGRIVLPANEAIKSLVIKPRFYGVPAADPSKVVIKGVTVPAGIPTTVQNLVIRPTGDCVVTDVNAGNPLAINLGSGVNTLTVENVTIDGLEETYLTKTGTLIFDMTSADGSVVNFTGCTINADPGNAGRIAQIYGGKYTFDGCTFNGGYPDYAMRLYLNTDMTVKNSVINVPNNWINLRTGGNEFAGKVTPAIEVDAEYHLISEDSNIYGPDVVRVYTGNTKVGSGTQSIYPAKKGGEGIVKLGAICYPTLTAAIAAAPSGSVIEVGEGEIDDNVKVPNGKTLTIKGAGPAKSVINGNLEISGSLTIKDLTLKTKENVTNKDLGVKVSGDNYEWGHIYLARVENGATDVTFENVRFDATTEVADFASTMSMLWISQAKNVKVINCQFDAVAGGAYCPNQTHEADVLWSGNVFNGLGKKAWAIRVMDKTDAVITGNEFNIAGEAIELYNDFLNYKGSLIMGDGVVDDNYYGTGVTHAIFSAYGLADYIFNGVTIKPTSLSFNTPTTSGKREPKLSLVWSHIDDAAWGENVALGNVRNITANTNGVYLVNTAGIIHTVSLEDGSFVKNVNVGTTGGLFQLDGAAALSDGTIILSNMANAVGQKFKVMKYDGEKVDTLAQYVIANVDGAVPRLGDMISVSGTAEAPVVYALDYSCPTSVGGKGRIFTFKPASKADGYSSMEYFGGMNCGRVGIGSFTMYKDNKALLQWDNANMRLLNYQEWGGTAADEIVPADITNKCVRSARFFTAGDSEFAALLEMSKYNGSNSYGAVIRVYKLATGNLVNDLNGATALASYEIPSATASGNACGSLEVIQKDGKVFIAAGIRSTGVVVLELKL